MALGKTRIKFYIELATFAIVVLGDALLIPRWGAIGAAVALSTGLLFWNTALYGYLKARQGISWGVGKFHIAYMVLVVLATIVLRWFAMTNEHRTESARRFEGL